MHLFNFHYLLGVNKKVSVYHTCLRICLIILFSIVMRVAETKSDIINSQKTPDVAPSWASYVVPIVRIWVDMGHVIIALHCI